MGESGCGKTTVGRLILRLEEPTAGEISFEGINLVTASPAEMQAVRRKVQVIFQDPYSSLNPRMTVGQIIGEPLHVYDLVSSGKAGRRARRGAARPGRAAAGNGDALSAPALRRAAPARRHRPRARHGAVLHRLRRGGVGARRVDPGPDHQSAGGPAAQVRPRLSVHRPRPRGGAAHFHARGGDVFRPHHGGGRPRCDLSRGAASLYQGAARRRAGARPHGREGARAAPDQGRAAEPSGSADRMRL